ncbi:uncharacterized protein LOC62_06G008752 [Vanrija pseudolonga]|uniref:Uncharacterized protein n=1 Tax=Vanrija pseudolonga TaxID=143232 RepID=A0AAF0YF85_9TREE|nr:hypothetical protein LOC62_06G008752 [Vanrija pseudolonga]
MSSRRNQPTGSRSESPIDPTEEVSAPRDFDAEAYWPRDDESDDDSNHHGDEGMDGYGDEDEQEAAANDEVDEEHRPSGTYLSLSPTELATDDEGANADVHPEESDESDPDSDDESESDSWSRSSSNHRAAARPSTSRTNPKHTPRAHRDSDDEPDSGADAAVDTYDNGVSSHAATSTAGRKRKRDAPSSEDESEHQASHEDNFASWPKGREREEIHADLNDAQATLEWWDSLAEHPGDLDPRGIKLLVLPHPLLRGLLESDWPVGPIDEAYREQVGHIRDAAIWLFKKLQFSTFRGKVIYLRRALRLITTPPAPHMPRCAPCARQNQSCVEGVEGRCQYCNLFPTKICDPAKAQRERKRKREEYERRKAVDVRGGKDKGKQTSDGSRGKDKAPKSTPLRRSRRPSRRQETEYNTPTGDAGDDEFEPLESSRPGPGPGVNRNDTAGRSRTTARSSPPPGTAVGTPGPSTQRGGSSADSDTPAPTSSTPTPGRQPLTLPRVLELLRAHVDEDGDTRRQFQGGVILDELESDLEVISSSVDVSHLSRHLLGNEKDAARKNWAEFLLKRLEVAVSRRVFGLGASTDRPDASRSSGAPEGTDRKGKRRQVDDGSSTAAGTQVSGEASPAGKKESSWGFFGMGLFRK